MTSIAFLFCATFSLTITAVSADECSTYDTLREVHRSTLFVPQTGDKLLCDRALPTKWYRFSNGDMPTSCVPTLHCGTQIPIWLNGQLPTVQGTTVTLSACFNYGQSVDPTFYGGSACCHTSTPIQVKNCGSFNVYHLSRTGGCHMAYCAGNKAVCNYGQSSIGSVNCTDLYPKLTQAPILGKPIVVDSNGNVGNTCSTSGTVKFPCHIPYPKREPDVAFEVTWTANGSDPILIPGTQNPVVTVLTGDDRDALLDGKYMKGHMGTTLQCTVRSYHKSTPGNKSPVRQSNEFWAGIRVHNQSITVDEKGPEQEISLESTVPISCNSPFQQTCGISVEMKASADPNDVSTTSCNYNLVCDPATNTYKAAIKVTATRDFVKDGNQLHELAFRPIFNPISNPMWDGYTLKPVEIRSIDRPHGKCSTSGDPHVYQIDSGRNVPVHQIGDFVFYKSLARPFEIRTWGCGSFRPCTCSVIAREGNDVVEVDMCASRRDQIAAPHLSPLPLKGTTVDVDSTGTIFDINFPSGAHLVINAGVYHASRNEYDGHLTLNLQVPTDDLGKGLGLCGTYDNNKNNDLIGGLNPGTSMFDQKPAYSPSAAINNTNLCQCDHHRADCTKAKANNPLAHFRYPENINLSVKSMLRSILNQLQYADSDLFTIAHMNAFDFECQDTVLRDINNYVTGSRGERIPTLDVTTHVCRNQCSRLGTCHEGTCACQTGYTGDDCSVPVGVAPVASHIRGDGLCDVGDRKCVKVQFIARHLMAGPGLKCRYKKAEHGSGNIIPYGEYIEAPASLTNFLEVECTLPESIVFHKESASEAFVVSVTTDGALYSTDLPFLVYDGSCQTCTLPGGCSLKDNTCLIDNVCHVSGDQGSDDSYCDPAADPYSWTKKPEVSEINHYTAAGSGCQCSYDNTRFDCACCTNGGCQCGYSHHNICINCSHTSMCSSYPKIIVGN
ncbi:von Willebrand factor D and EGF domain-containing protein-like [Argopecten irradians]|uniref:von Willebrand factor D and EGF domain-containing protein-like n=1 Tax=Argopecten irradians TaxID=31199 RepID=UPI003712058F